MIDILLYTQAPFNTVTVETIGDMPAPTYFEMDSTGRVTLTNSVEQDTVNQYVVWYDYLLTQGIQVGLEL